MKLRVIIPVLLALMAGPALGMEKPLQELLEAYFGQAACPWSGWALWIYRMVSVPIYKESKAQKIICRRF